MDRVIVIGGGPAGMAAALCAAWCGDQVTLLEQKDRLGKKLLATGNGRCNLMNVGPWRYPGGEAFAHAVLSRCGAAEQTAFWQHLGLPLRQEGEGRVYPVSGQASTVLDALRFALTDSGVRVITGGQARGLTPTPGGWQVHMPNGKPLEAQRVIVAGGGVAQPRLGGDGGTYQLLEGLGYRLVPLRPALTQIVLRREEVVRSLTGLRVRCTVTVERDNQPIHQEKGEVLFTDYGISGVCVMQCARWADAPHTRLVLNLCEALGFPDTAALQKELDRRRTLFPERLVDNLFSGLCVSRIGQALLARGKIPLSQEHLAQLTDAELQRLCGLAERFTMTVQGVKGFDNAQITAGGIATDAFDPATMASRLHRGLHAAGELLDVDGDCGGFNLMFAFGSGILAGLNGRPIPFQKG